MNWIKRHERALWWLLLTTSVIVGAIRNPDCASQASWWWYALPFAIFLVLWVSLIWRWRR